MRWRESQFGTEGWEWDEGIRLAVELKREENRKRGKREREREIERGGGKEEGCAQRRCQSALRCLIKPLPRNPTKPSPRLNPLQRRSPLKHTVLRCHPVPNPAPGGEETPAASPPPPPPPAAAPRRSTVTAASRLHGNMFCRARLL